MTTLPVSFDLTHGSWTIAHDLEAVAHIDLDDMNELYVSAVEMNGNMIEFGSLDPIERVIYNLVATKLYRTALDEAEEKLLSEQWSSASSLFA